MMKRSLLAGITALLILPSPLLAQGAQDIDRESHFGVIANFGLPSDLGDKFKILINADRTEISSRDFEVGFIVRGRQLGGDWGVSYTQKKYREGSVIHSGNEFCFNDVCQKVGSQIMRDVRLRGLMVHKFVPFGTIKRRAQIGLNFGGGFAQARGTAESHEFDVVFNPPTFTPVLVERVSLIDAKELFLDGTTTIPLWRLEAMAAALLAPGVKVRVGVGLNFANYPAVSVSASYLFNSR